MNTPTSLDPVRKIIFGEKPEELDKTTQGQLLEHRIKVLKPFLSFMNGQEFEDLELTEKKEFRRRPNVFKLSKTPMDADVLDAPAEFTFKTEGFFYHLWFVDSPVPYEGESYHYLFLTKEGEWFDIKIPSKLEWIREDNERWPRQKLTIHRIIVRPIGSDGAVDAARFDDIWFWLSDLVYSWQRQQAREYRLAKRISRLVEGENLIVKSFFVSNNVFEMITMQDVADEEERKARVG